MRTRKERPDVYIELMLANDGHWVSGSKANARRLEYSKTAARAIRVRVGRQIWWSLDVDSAITSRIVLIDDISRQANQLGIGFQSLHAALHSRMLWSEDQSLALAIAFAFPSPIRWDRASLKVIRTGRGRPPVLDTTWQEVVRLARAWAAVTEAAPGIGPHALFVVAVEAAASCVPSCRPIAY